MTTTPLPLSPGEVETIRRRARRRLQKDAGDHAAEETLRLVATIEDREDLAAIHRAREDGDALPGEMVRRMVAGESPLKLFREHRGMTQAALAARIGVRQPHLSLVEHGRKGLSAEALAAAAEALGVRMEDLV